MGQILLPVYMETFFIYGVVHGDTLWPALLMWALRQALHSLALFAIQCFGQPSGRHCVFIYNSGRYWFWVHSLTGTVYGGTNTWYCTWGIFLDNNVNESTLWQALFMRDLKGYAAWDIWQTLFYGKGTDVIAMGTL